MSQALDNSQQQAQTMDALETCFQCAQKKPLRDFLVTDKNGQNAQFSTICADCRGQLVQQEQGQERAFSSTHMGDIDDEKQQLFDSERDYEALQRIRQEEAERFAHVDEATHKTKRQHDIQNTEGLESMPGAEPHPVLAESTYFNGVDDNPPDPALNQEFQQNQQEYQLNKQPSPGAQPTFDPNKGPSPF